MFKKFSLILLTALVCLFALTAICQADTTDYKTWKDATKLTNTSATGAGFITAQPDLIYTVVAGVINVLLGLVGAIFVSMFIYAGSLWMFSQGKDDKISKSKNIMTFAVIGLVIVIGGYSITSLIATQVQLGQFTPPPAGTGQEAGSRPGDSSDDPSAPPAPPGYWQCSAAMKDADSQQCCNNYDPAIPSPPTPIVPGGPDGDDTARCLAYDNCKGFSVKRTQDCYPSVCCLYNLDCSQYRIKSTCEPGGTKSINNGAFHCEWSTLAQTCEVKSGAQ